ncbi:hypothetical protein L195_g013409 [Trifolium pratense]|uniref:Reverse transcriptase zinc-binding domain-containing protein n=1 Tax=Trifolium pratense TaxID=57577 RepID=A0A2K3PN46_TRIPR|nr:hypothetical protein L195_g013409 [Trifolium pratense]
MPTDENLVKRGCVVVSVCVLCFAHLETTVHLFLSCPFAQQLRCWLGSLLHYVLVTNSITSLLSQLGGVITC